MLERKRVIQFDLDWDKIRVLFGGRLIQSQVDGINAIVSVASSDEFGVSDKRVLAYMLATSYWETARTMQAIKEHGGNSYFHRMYDIEGSRPHVAKRLGNTNSGDGIKFAGRGHVQLTGRTNYSKMGNYLGLDLISDPDLLLDIIPSTRVLVYGMLNGSFTGVGIGKFINSSLTDYVNARKVINGLDKARDIANIARRFEEAINDVVINDVVLNEDVNNVVVQGNEDVKTTEDIVAAEIINVPTESVQQDNVKTVEASPSLFGFVASLFGNKKDV